VNVQILNQDNGERFVSIYLHDQIQRNREVVGIPNNDMCMCPHCGSNMIEIGGYQVVTQELVVNKPPAAKMPPQEKSHTVRRIVPVYPSIQPPQIMECPSFPRPFPHIVQPNVFPTMHQLSVAQQNYLMQQQMGMRQQFAAQQPSQQQMGMRQQFAAQQPSQTVPLFGPSGQWISTGPPKTKKQKQFCCPHYAQYMTETVPQHGKSSGRPPHSKGCHYRKK
jgi:hypothetical protein